MSCIRYIRSDVTCTHDDDDTLEEAMISMILLLRLFSRCRNKNFSILLKIINNSLEFSWVHPIRKIPEIILAERIEGDSLSLDNVRPITLTSVIS